METEMGTHDISGNTRPSISKARHWQLTLNQTEYFNNVWEYLTSRKNCIYAIACEETAPSTGHIHNHIYAQYNIPVALSIKKCCGAHIENCRGTPQENVNYIKKDGKIIAEYGEFRSWGGNRMPTIKEVQEMSEADVCTLPANLINCVKKIRNEVPGERYWKPVYVEWHYGPTGSGKTRKAFEDGAEPVEYHNGFFTDWGGARVIVLEEMRGQIPYPELLKILDDYHNYYKVNIKGGFKYVDLDKVYITSPKTPHDCYPNQDRVDSIKQLDRRINEIIEHKPSVE